MKLLISYLFFSQLVFAFKLTPMAIHMQPKGKLKSSVVYVENARTSSVAGIWQM